MQNVELCVIKKIINTTSTVIQFCSNMIKKKKDHRNEDFHNIHDLLLVSNIT